MTKASGFSGAKLWRSTNCETELLLRRWPEGTGRERLEAIYWLLFQLRFCSGLAFVPYLGLRSPEGAFVWSISHAGALWTLQPYLPGEPAGERPAPAKLRNALRAVAQFHLAAVESQVCEHVRDGEFAHRAPGPAIGLKSRTQLAASFLQTGLACLQAAVIPIHLRDIQSRRERLLPLASEVAPRLLVNSQPALLWQVPLIPCLRDIHSAHVLFTGDEVTGLIDYDAMRIDSVATDLARLLGSYCSDDFELWDVGLKAYDEIRPLSKDERDLVVHYDRFAVLLTGLQWLDWILLEGKQFELAKVLPRIDATLLRLEHLSHRLRTSGGIVLS
jgi:homoserine kinase type II